MIGCIDGTHIPITASSHNERLQIKENPDVLIPYINFCNYSCWLHLSMTHVKEDHFYALLRLILVPIIRHLDLEAHIKSNFTNSKNCTSFFMCLIDRWGLQTGIQTTVIGYRQV